MTIVGTATSIRDNSLQEFKAADTWHVQVQYQTVGRLVGQRIKKCLAGVERSHVHISRGQQASERLADRRVVVDD